MTNREEIVGSVGVWPLKLLAKRWVCSDAAIRDREKSGLPGGAAEHPERRLA